jgi:hypothetical protein
MMGMLCFDEFCIAGAAVIIAVVTIEVTVAVNVAALLLFGC